MINFMNCSDCQNGISPAVRKSTYVVTPCFHVFCIECLKQWVSKIEKPCPLCRVAIIQPRSGKDFITIWKIFVRIFNKDPDLVWKILSIQDNRTDNCSSCLEDFPNLDICYDMNKKIFKHLDCSKSLPQLTMRDVVYIVNVYSSHNEELHDFLVPIPATIIEKMVSWFWNATKFR